jgi:hypothetical protein
MKKSRGVKRKVSHHKKQNKSSRYLRFLPAAFILVVLVVLVLSVVIHPATGNAISGNADLAPSGSSTLGAGTNFISDLFTQWQGGNLDVNIAKYLFWLMLTGLIWGALSFAKFPPAGIFQALIAIPVGFLATAYITPTEIFTILTSYTALGITLSFVLPFMIMLFVSAMLLSNETVRQMSIPKVLLEVFLWIFYLIILGYKLIEGLVSGQIEFGLSLTVVIMFGIFLITLIIVTFNKRFRNYMWDLGNDIRRAQARAATTEAAEAARTANAIERARNARGNAE